jgi:putative hydrolase of the HAD superfamily
MSSKYMFLDLDDTLYDYRLAHIPAQAELVTYLSNQLKINRKSVSSGLNGSRSLVKERLGASASSHSRLIYVSEYLRHIDCQSHVELTLAGESLYWNTFLKNMRIFQGVPNFLLASRQSGFTNILVTDLTASIQRRKLRLLKIDTLFEVVLTSEEAGGDKVSGLPEKFLGNFLGPIEGVCIGNVDTDHLFKDKTSFYKKSKRLIPVGTKSRQEFTSFSKLQKRLFPVFE